MISVRHFVVSPVSQNVYFQNIILLPNLYNNSFNVSFGYRETFFHNYLHLSLPFLFYPRYLTMSFYLSSVEEGGETTFPVADNRTYEEQVSVLSQPTVINQQSPLSFFCHCEMMITVHMTRILLITHRRCWPMTRNLTPKWTQCARHKLFTVLCVLGIGPGWSWFDRHPGDMWQGEPENETCCWNSSPLVQPSLWW